MLFLCPPIPFTSEDIKSCMGDHYTSVTSGTDVLGVLSAMTFGGGDTDVRERIGVSKLPKVKAKSFRHSRHGDVMTSIVDMKPFKILGISIPNSRPEAEKAIADIIATQRLILQVEPSELWWSGN